MRWEAINLLPHFLVNRMITIEEIDNEIEKGPFKPTWESLSKNKIPSWFRDAKFGIFTHWGLYTIPEYHNEWYSRNMYRKDAPEFEYHRKTYGLQKNFGYKDFIPMFTAKKFNPEEWLKLFKTAGAKYYFPVAEHHDGFQMYKSELSHWNAFEKGPKQDILGKLKKAAQEEKMNFCTSNHRAEHWWFMGHGKEFDSDIHEPLKKGDFYWPAMPEPDNQELQSKPYPSEEYLEDWLLRNCELVKNYQPKMIYFDWWIQHQAFKPYFKKFAAYYYNLAASEWKTNVTICYKEDAMAFGTGLVDLERGSSLSAKPFPWQCDTSIARNSWCYTKTLDYKSVNEILQNLIDVIAKNGNLLLNVGPKADGSIAEKDQKILTEIGSWLSQNGEAIYGSRPWKIAGEGNTQMGEGSFQDQNQTSYNSSDIRFTTNKGNLYAILLHPDQQDITIKSLKLSNQDTNPSHCLIKKVIQLDDQKSLTFHETNDGLHVKIKPNKQLRPIVLKIEVE